LRTSRNIARGSYGSRRLGIVAWKPRAGDVFSASRSDERLVLCLIGLDFCTDSSSLPSRRFPRGSSPHVREGAACALRNRHVQRGQRRARPDLLRMMTTPPSTPPQLGLQACKTSPAPARSNPPLGATGGRTTSASLLLICKQISTCRASLSRYLCCI